MENRFGLKDLLLFLLIGLSIVLVLLGMKQYDRQWAVIQQVQAKQNEQTEDLARIERMLQQGSVGISRMTNTTRPDESERADLRAIRIHSAPDYAQGDAVVDVFQQIPDKLTPLISTDLYSQYVQGYVLDTLLDRDPITLKWIPRLATKWTVSPDGMTIDFTIRKGVTFSNGDSLTADDVVYTIALTQNERIEAPRLRTYLDKLSKVEKVGDDGVRFVFKEPYFMALETAGSTQVLSKKFYSQFTPQQINESTGYLLGSGPYRLADPKSWRPEPGKPIELVRNERYWGEPGGPNRLTWRIINLPAAEMTALRNGEIDVFYQPNPNQFLEITKDPELPKRLNTFAIDTLTAGFYYIGWNEAREGKPTYFADPRVRRAMTMLLDRHSMAHDIMHDLAIVPSGPFSYLSPQSDPSVKPLPYDPDKAKQLLTEAGFKLKDDVMVGPDGKQFVFDFMYGANREVGKQVATYTHDALARVGIVVRLQPVEWQTMLSKTKERNYDATFMGWGGTVEDDPEQIFTTKAMKGVGDNFVQYSNPKLDEVIEKARFTPDVNARNELWHQVHRMIAEDQPYTFMFADKELDAVDRRFKGVEATKLGIIGLKNEWYVPRAAQKFTE